MEAIEIQKIEEQRNNLVEMAEEHQVNNQSEADAANVIIIKLKAGLKEIEKKRLSFTAPLNQTLRELNQTFKDMTAPVNEAIRNLTHRLMDWRSEEQRRIREEQERLAEEARKRDEKRHKIQEAHKEMGHETAELEPTPIQQVAPLEAKDTTKIRKNWDFRVVDFSKVPNPFKEINGVLVRRLMMEAVKSAKEQGKEELELEIEGIEFYQKEVPIFA